MVVDPQHAADDGARRRPHRALATGVILEDRYQIMRIAGRGGMSVVYVARDLRFGQVERLCAVKEMFDVDPDSRVRALRLVNFERESALLATLSHPAIPRIYDYFSRDGQVYLVLEYIDGHDLERVLNDRRSPFDEEPLLRWAIEICDVLEMLHQQKPDPVIFRDLKPSNIMLRTGGQVVLIDFGIARTIQGRQRGTMIGTEGYAPPEQYRGIADARGDIYALGATLHHLATNHDPRSETPFTFHERPARTLNPAISEEFSAVIMKMVAYTPSDRYQSVRELRLDLEALLRRSYARGAEADLFRLSTGAALHVPAAAPPAAAVEDATGTVLLDAAVPDTTTPDVPAPSPTPTTTVARKRGIRRRREIQELTERQLWATTTGDEVRGSACFDGASFLVGSYDGYLYAVSPTDGSIRWRFATGRGVVSRPAVFEDLVLFGSEDHAIYALRRDTGDMAWTFRANMPVRSSPAVIDDCVVIGADDATVYALNARDGAQRWKQRTWGPVRSSPVGVGSAVYVGGDDTYLYCLDIVSGHVRWRSACGSAIQAPPVVTAGLVIVTARAGSVVAFHRENGRRQWTWDAGSPLLAAPVVVDDGVLIGSVDGAVTCLAADAGEPRWSSRVANQITGAPLVGPSRVYLGSVDGDVIAVRHDSGDTAWRFRLAGGIVSTPAVGHGVLAVGSLDGRIYGLALDDQEQREFAASVQPTGVPLAPGQTRALEG